MYTGELWKASKMWGRILQIARQAHGIVMGTLSPHSPVKQAGQLAGSEMGRSRLSGEGGRINRLAAKMVEDLATCAAC